MGNNQIGSKLLEILAGIDKNKLEEAGKMLNNMSKDDLNNIITMLSKNGNNK